MKARTKRGRSKATRKQNPEKAFSPILERYDVIARADVDELWKYIGPDIIHAYGPGYTVDEVKKHAFRVFEQTVAAHRIAFKRELVGEATFRMTVPGITLRTAVRYMNDAWLNSRGDSSKSLDNRAHGALASARLIANVALRNTAALKEQIKAGRPEYSLEEFRAIDVAYAKGVKKISLLKNGAERHGVTLDAFRQAYYDAKRSRKFTPPDSRK